MTEARRILPDPNQIAAADPSRSVFVTANAGSGKTSTLVDRVARLLLEGVEPGEILCVTYTKAAAAEMQSRLFERLGAWAVMDDAALEQSLADLDGRRVGALDHDALSRRPSRSASDCSSAASSMTAQAPSRSNRRDCISAAAALV